MTFDEIPGMEFYNAKNDKNMIFAECELPADESTKKVKKLMNIRSPEFASFWRLVVLPNLTEKISVQKIIQLVTDYIAVYGCSDVIEPKVRTAGKLVDGIVEYALYNFHNEFVNEIANVDFYAAKESNT